MPKKVLSSILSTSEEQKIIDWIDYCAERGFPITKTQLLDTVQKFVTELENPFKDNRPGRHWYEVFMKRHPQFTFRMSQNLNKTRAAATEEVIRLWFQEVKDHLKKLNLLNIHPSRLYNCDESAFALHPKGDYVLVRRGCKAVYKVISGNEKESLTVLFMVNAEGTMGPPMILYWYERMPYAVSNKIPSGWSFGNTKRMDDCGVLL